MDSNKLVGLVGRVVTLMRLAKQINIERRGRHSVMGQDVLRFIVVIDVPPAAIAANKNPYGPNSFYQQNEIGDAKAGRSAISATDKLIGRDTLKAAGCDLPPLTRDERAELDKHLVQHDIVKRAPRKPKREKRTARGRRACPKCGQPLDDGVCKPCAGKLLERDDDGLFDIG